jgi:hypothetical protein
MRPQSKPVNTFQFGAQTITTKVHMMVPDEPGIDLVDVVAALHEPTIGHDVTEDVFENLYE